MWLFALFIAVPLIEIALFVQVGGWLTLWPTLGIVLGTAIVGTWLLRWQGTQVLRDLQREMQSLGNPVSPLAHGALILVGGVMMILPGFFTDCLGILLMIPPVRRLVIRLVLARISAKGMASFSFGPRPRGYDDGTIDGDFSELPPEYPKNRGPSGWTKD
jgi:UPF0716 protein FxsA